MVYTVEQARKVLKEYEGESSFDTIFRPFWEAVRDETLPNYYLLRLSRYLCYSTEVPPKREDGYRVGIEHPEFPNMLCRRNPRIGVCLNLGDLLDADIVKDPAVIDKITGILNHPWNDSGGKGEFPTTKAELDMLVGTISEVCNYLISEYNLEINLDETREQVDRERQEYRRKWGVLD